MKAGKLPALKPVQVTQMIRDLDTAGVFLTQARGIIETVIALKPIASELNDGEIGQALYGAVDQLNRALALVDGDDANQAERLAVQS